MRVFFIPGKPLPHLAAFALLVSLGCGSKSNFAPVAGIITVDGQPLAGASITTQPIATDSTNPGSGSFGSTDSAGRFELELVKPAQKGAIVGEHRVMISPASAAAALSEPQRTADGVEYWIDAPQRRSATSRPDWPARFTDGSLRLTVPPDGNPNVRFDLQR